MRVPWWLPLAGAVVLSGAVWWYGAYREGVGLDRGLLEARSARVETLRVEVRKLDTVVREKLRTFTQWKTQYDSTHDTITVTRDTGRVVYVNKALADNTLESCQQGVLALQSSCAKKDTLIASQDSVISSLRALKGKRCKLGVGLGIGGGSTGRRNRQFSSALFGG